MKRWTTARGARWLVLSIPIACLVVYANALGNDFVYDDMGQVVQNHWIRNVRHLPDIFSKSVWSFQKETVVSNYYRPLMHSTYMLSYYLFGLKPWGFHLVNLLFHMGSSVMVFFVVSRLARRRVRETPAPESGPHQKAVFAVALLSALLFATHPMHTEAVTWIAGLPEVSFSFFFLLSIYLYMESGVAVASNWRLPLSIVCFAAAVLCKETALTLLLLLVAYDYTFEGWENLGRRARRYLPYLAVAVVYFGARLHALGGLAPEKRHQQLSIYEYAINVPPLFAKYLGKLLLPAGFNAFHLFHPVHSVIDPRSLVGIAAVAAFITCAEVARRRHRGLFFCFAVIAVPLLPVLYIPALGENTFAERYLYLPSVGYVALLAAAIVALGQRDSARKVAGAVVVAILVAYSALTVSRNETWKSNYTLFSDTAQKAPSNPAIQDMLGNAMVNEGKLDAALVQYDRAIALNPTLPAFYVNRGEAWQKLGQMQKAMADFDKAIAIDPRWYQAYNNKGQVFGAEGLLDQAMAQFDKAIEINPEAAFSYGNRGLVHFLQGNYEKALRDLDKAIELDSSHAGAYGTRGNVYLKTGFEKRAIEDFRKACDLGDKRGCDVLEKLGRTGLRNQ